jgi:copper chaperone CopZ
MGEITLKIYGMHDDHCVKQIKKVIDNLEGVTSSEVYIAQARVQVDESMAAEYDLIKAIHTIGYRVAQQ